MRSMLPIFRVPRRLAWSFLALIAFIGALAYLGFEVWRAWHDPQQRGLLAWAAGDEAVRQTLVTSGREPCPGAPFILPADGYIGLLYGDPRGPYSRTRPHQGIDIFSDADPGVTPVYAAYDGYVTRESDWVSTLIQRVPQDPLRPEEQIWLYYTHMADERGDDFIEPAFPPGTRELFVARGTLLGYTGNYNGRERRPVWTHLHFSIVLDDGAGGYRNELEFTNTLDPSPYLGLTVAYADGADVGGCLGDG